MRRSISKDYKFDEKLGSDDIKYVDRNEVNILYEEVRCGRCNATLRYVNTLRIEDEYYQIGDFCYDSIKVILSEIRGKSLYWIRIELEEGYDRYLETKYSSDNDEISVYEGNSPKYHPDYKIYETLKWDSEHGRLPSFKEEEYRKLKQQFEKKDN